jgi:hypothetical protein
MKKFKSLLLLAMAGMVMFAACEKEIIVKGYNSKSTASLIIHEVSADADAVSITVEAKDPWKIKPDTTAWCTVVMPPVANATNDSITVTANITRNTTGKTRLSFISVSYEIATETYAEVCVTMIEIIQEHESVINEDE